ncbi:MAG: hypothetical protein OXG26_19570 [Caldilineaceae bacterium]|nr:hypothetical protein [Caldilineaceae bacterium]MDE0632507.1 hypothetical protein [Caldilineaceae bacterium]MXZ22082.1 hypothetical protein [Caldilineaceae bacterium SB0665_bin_25]
MCLPTQAALTPLPSLHAFHWHNPPSCATIPDAPHHAARPRTPLTMPGQLFTSYFLEEGILHTAAWQESLSQPAEVVRKRR